MQPGDYTREQENQDLQNRMEANFSKKRQERGDKFILSQVKDID